MSFLRTTIYYLLENNNLLSSRQYGFRKGRSTELATTLLLDDICKEVNECKIVGAVFIDLSKAFDTLGHSILLSKMKSYGITSIEFDWFSDYLFDRKQVCFYEGESSEVFKVKCGVPQGSILGPLLFLIHFNDFSDIVKHSKVIQFADDTVIYVSEKCFDTIERKLKEDFSLILQATFL